MFKNYLKIAWRNLWKNRLISGINIGGLAIGITSAILLLGYVSYQYSYDNVHTNKRDLYRVNLDYYQQGQLVFKSAENYSGVGPSLKSEFPEVIAAARLYNVGSKNNCVITADDNRAFKETKVLFADPSFLTMFSFPFKEGDPHAALDQAGSAVISASMALKLFGSEHVLGKMFRMDDDDGVLDLCRVTGVFKDVPGQSHIKFDVLISYASLYHRSRPRFENNWQRKDLYTYVQLRQGADPAILETKLPGFVSRHIPAEKENAVESRLSLQPVEKIHLAPGRDDEPEPGGSAKAIFFLMLIAFFIITIAWVNYINLSTAGSINRAREIGIRKVLGSQKIQLIKQFLAEALATNIVSFTIAIGLTVLLLQWMRGVFPDDFSLPAFLCSSYGWLFLGFLVIGALLSGLYPAFVMSSFKPALVVKGGLKASGKGILLRRGLVVFQFALSIFLIIGTIVVYQQVHFMLNQDLGLKMSRVVIMDRPGRWASHSDSLNGPVVQAFKELLKRNPAIESMGMSDALPGKETRWHGEYSTTLSGDKNEMSIKTIDIDEDYLHVLGISMKAGRNFSRKYGTDQHGLVISESAAKLLGFTGPEDAVGKQVWTNKRACMVLGVTSDVHLQSLQKKAEPLVFQFNGRDYSDDEYYLIKIKTADIPRTIGYIRKSWEEIFPGNPFSFSFLDDYFNRQYDNDMQFGLLFGVFSMVAIIIACIGLFALVAYMVQQRTREIGIRKVLGASLRDILALFTKDFTKLILIANLIAWPLGWFLMNSWLREFAYRIHISWLVFLLAGVSALIIALMTISLQALKAAIANPVKAIRAE